MANYLQFSFEVPLKSDDQRAWAEGLCQFLLTCTDLDPSTDEFLRYSEVLEDPEDPDNLYVNAEVSDGLLPALGGETVNWRKLWIYAEESGTPDHAARIVEAFVSRFKTDPISFQWAETCSKPRVDEFAGGACWVSQDETRWMHTSSWIAAQK